MWPTYVKAKYMLQITLNLILRWFEKWGLFLSAPKSAVMVFKRCNAITKLNLKGKEQNVHLVTTHKDLGFTLDSRLTFEEHFASIRAGCLQWLNILKCVAGMMWGSDRNSLTLFYCPPDSINCRLELYNFLYSKPHTPSTTGNNGIFLPPGHHWCMPNHSYVISASRYLLTIYRR